MSAEIELALLVLLRATTGEIDLSQFQSPPLIDSVDGTTASEALAMVTAGLSSASPIDRFAAAQSFVLGLQLPDDPTSSELLAALGDQLLSTVGGDSNGGSQLRAALDLLRHEQQLNPAVLDLMQQAFGGALTVIPNSSELLTLSGSGSSLATMLVELVANFSSAVPKCRSLDVDDPISGQHVTLVEVDVCTNQPFDKCKLGIDPLRWPQCNPYFQSVTLIGAKTPDAGGGWAGVVKEKVGPALNGSVYETDLAVRYIDRPGVVCAAFDLAATRNDDGRVTVDRGFLSVTDEGLHRRVRVLKVYRISDLTTPHTWLCPLWASQVAMAGWWCP